MPLYKVGQKVEILNRKHEIPDEDRPPTIGEILEVMVGDKEIVYEIQTFDDSPTWMWVAEGGLRLPG